MNDWNLLIVHYLGLDHIGHASGAFNSLIKDKLSVQAISELFNTEQGAIYRDIRIAKEELSVLLFGITALELAN